VESAVFVDESGLSQRPHRYRTWAPRWQTPILPYNFDWKRLSAAAHFPGAFKPAAALPVPPHFVEAIKFQPRGHIERSIDNARKTLDLGVRWRT
jgi:hypothetical protein